ncbi:G-protein coupled receptor GRL101-like [Mytilus trossulus]|uniref:G-protein coupled receptor GRL101-like n=1 Tax=Mytilus trossulus TaxID=6551 RepID=UPI00300592A7
MGIYMLTIASADVMFRGNYVWNDLSWRYGVSCKIAGILSTVSSESSVVFLFLITIDRFIAVKYPFGEIRFGKTSAIRISVVVFLTSFIISIIPLFPGSYFDGNFYSRSAVCLALPLTRDKPNGWEYSFGIFIVFNFILFLIIAVTQLVIYKEVTNPIQIRSTKKNQDLTIARKLFLVVFSDFLCWFPVGVMGLMALRGYSIPAEVYAWTAVFILPINSALNPFLYTFASIRGNRSLQQKNTYLTGNVNSKESNASRRTEQGKGKVIYDENTEDDEKDNLEVFGKGKSYNAVQHSDGSPPANALDGLIANGASYVSERPYVKPWYLLNLEKCIEVHAIVLYRKQVWYPINNRYVGTYVSKHRWDFLTYGAYRCDDNRNPWKHKIFRFQCKRPIIGQYISVKNFDFTDPDEKQGYFHYFEIDEIQVVGRCKYHIVYLGVPDIP